MPETSVIILNYNQKDITVACVNSVLSQTYTDFEIILVDNASVDGSFEIFKKEFGKNKKIILIKSEKNLGYTGGNNLGVSRTHGKYVVILNNDTFCENDWLEELIKVVKFSKDVAMVSSNIVNVPDGDLKRMHEVKDLFNKRIKGTHSVLGYDVSLGEELKEDFCEIVAAHGGSFIFKKNIIGNKPFDQQYFIYAEETKLAWLTRIRGYKILWAKKARVYHLHNTVRRTDPGLEKNFRFIGERNKFTNWLTFYEFKTTVKLIPIYSLAILMLNIFEPNKILQRFRAYLWVLVHPNWWIPRRKEIQSQRKVLDNKLFKKMSCKLTDETRVSGCLRKKILSMLNTCCIKYFKLVRLRGIEV